MLQIYSTDTFRIIYVKVCEVQTHNTKLRDLICWRQNYELQDIFNKKYCRLHVVRTIIVIHKKV